MPVLPLRAFMLCYKETFTFSYGEFKQRARTTVTSDLLAICLKSDSVWSGWSVVQLRPE